MYRRSAGWVSLYFFFSQGTNLLAVALHELGHALGLDHSEDTNSIMYAFYDCSKTTLTADDIAGIQAIYGGR